MEVFRCFSRSLSAHKWRRHRCRRRPIRKEESTSLSCPPLLFSFSVSPEMRKRRTDCRASSSLFVLGATVNSTQQRSLSLSLWRIEGEEARMERRRRREMRKYFLHTRDETKEWRERERERERERDWWSVINCPGRKKKKRRCLIRHKERPLVCLKPKT